jgi:hypothetical protein
MSDSESEETEKNEEYSCYRSEHKCKEWWCFKKNIEPFYEDLHKNYNYITRSDIKNKVNLRIMHCEYWHIDYIFKNNLKKCITL